jgi:hypothetical protein
MGMSVGAHELELYVENDGNLYRQMTTPILRNLATKKAKGEYKHDLAVKAFGYLADAGAKKYAKEFGGPGDVWFKMFPPADRHEVAVAFTKDFEFEYSLGNYNNDTFLPKKYQATAPKPKRGGGGGANMVGPNMAYYAASGVGRPGGGGGGAHHKKRGGGGADMVGPDQPYYLTNNAAWGRPGGGGGGARTKADHARLQRPSPTAHAANHKGECKRGHDGHVWCSVPDRNGVYHWKRV